MSDRAASVATRDDVCVHCGLPARGGYESDGLTFCCYGCYIVRRITRAEGGEGPAAFILARLGIGVFLAMNIMMVSLALYTRALVDMGPEALEAFRWGLLGLSTPVLLLLGTPFLRSAMSDLRRRRLAMDALVAVGCLAAYAISAAHVIRGEGHIYFDTATMLLVLVTLGKFLEASAKTRTAASIRGLMALTDGRATRMMGDERQEVALSDLTAGDVAEVVPGARVPADGTIIEGCSEVPEPTFTGEPAPRPCLAGDAVYGGSLNGDGRLLVRIEAVGDASLLGRMARVVEVAQSTRSPSELRADRISSLFIPFVWAMTIGAAAYWLIVGHDGARAGMSALAVLVVACPCALGLATPLATCLSIGVAARSGVLVRSGEVLERLPQLSTLLLDKTGTLTRGALVVSRVELVSPAGSVEIVLALAASLEAASGHVLGQAVVRAAQERGIELVHVTAVQALPGLGVTGMVEQDGEVRRVAVGAGALMEREGIAKDSLPDASGTTEAYVALEGRLAARLVFEDCLRPEVIEAVTDLRARGIELAVCSGDKPGPTAAIAEQAGIATWYADCTPETKPELVRAAQARGRCVGMIGDGVNDAPALAVAAIGIAMAEGADLAKETSDVTLLGNDLRRVPWLLGLADTTVRTINQNLAWAFGYNTVAIIIAFFGLLHPLIAAIAMLASSLVVTGNSLRLTRFSGDGSRRTQANAPTMSLMLPRHTRDAYSPDSE